MPKIEAVSFDLTGTLLTFTPSLGTMCAEIMAKLGVGEIPSAENLNRRKKQAQRVVLSNGFSPTSEIRSREYWRAMLWEIFAGTIPSDLFPLACEKIYKRIADPGSWCILPGALDALAAARFLGLRCIVLSNGDARWRNALKALGLDSQFDEIFLSSETGFAKPDSKAFEHVCLKVKIPRGNLLHVGDSLSHDVLPARAFGAETIWVAHAPDGAPPEDRVTIIDSLADLPEILRSRACADFSCTHFPKATRNLLALLRGLPEEQSPNPETIVAKKGGSESLTRKQKRINEAAYTSDREFITPAGTLEQILKSHGIFSGSAQSVIRDNWEKIIPSALVCRCTPAEIRDNWTTLVIACESPIIRQQLEFRKRTILKKLREFSGAENIKKIILTNELSG